MFAFIQGQKSIPTRMVFVHVGLVFVSGRSRRRTVRQKRVHFVEIGPLGWLRATLIYFVQFLAEEKVNCQTLHKNATTATLNERINSVYTKPYLVVFCLEVFPLDPELLPTPLVPKLLHFFLDLQKILLIPLAA